MLTDILVHSLHMIKKIPSSRKPITWNGPVAAFKEAKVGVVSVAVKSMGFPLMAEETSIGRKLKLGIHTSRNFAAVGFQMRIQIFVVCTFLRRGKMIAGLFSNGIWAVVFPVTPSGQRIIGVVSGSSDFRAVL